MVSMKILIKTFRTTVRQLVQRALWAAQYVVCPWTKSHEKTNQSLVFPLKLETVFYKWGGSIEKAHIVKCIDITFQVVTLKYQNRHSIDMSVGSICEYFNNTEPELQNVHL